MLETIILDIDETLIHTEIMDLYDYDFSFIINDRTYYVTKRPYLDEFISYISNYKIGVFTTSTKDYATEILNTIGLNKLEFLFDRSKCTMKYVLDLQERTYIKRLHSTKCDLDKCVIIDDRRETAMDNYGNLIEVKPFYCDKSDDTLLKLIDYLELIKDKNVRDIEKRGWYNNQKAI
jgi:Dullard-like phosphatase family protein